MSERSWIALLLAALVFAVFAQVRGHEFVDHDDLKHIVQNPDVASGLSPAAVARVFTRPHYGDFIPLTYVSLQLDRSLFGEAAAGTLLVNVALHAASAVLLFLALAQMTGRNGTSAFVAAVFAVHPLHVESVAWAFERKDALSGCFGMLALFFYAQRVGRPGPAAQVARSPQGREAAAQRGAAERSAGPREGAKPSEDQKRVARSEAKPSEDQKTWLWPVALCLAASLLAKPTLVTLPFALLLLDYWPLGRLHADRAGGALLDRAKLRGALLEKWPLFAIAAAAVALTLAFQSGASAHAGAERSFAERLASVPDAYLFYLQKSFWPAGLAAFYPPPRLATSTSQLVRAAALALALLAISAAALRWVRSRPYLATGWLWFLGTLVPVIGLVQLGIHSVADRYAYMPQIGLSWSVAWAASDALGRSPAARRALAALAAACVAALAIAAHRQVGYWRDTQSLFEHALAVIEDNFVAHWRLGVLDAQAGRTQQALAHLRQSIESEPGLAVTQYELAETLEEAGLREAAFQHYQQALAIDPAHAGANGRYGVALLELGRIDEARPLLQRSLAADTSQPRVHAGLAAAYAAAGRDAEAVEHYREALRLEPGYAPIANNLAHLLATSRNASVLDAPEAIRLAEAALALLPGEPAVMDTLALGLAAAGRVDDAIRTAERALELARARGDAALAAEIEAHLQRYRAPASPG